MLKFQRLKMWMEVPTHGDVGGTPNSHTIVSEICTCKECNSWRSIFFSKPISLLVLVTGCWETLCFESLSRASCNSAFSSSFSCFNCQGPSGIISSWKSWIFSILCILWVQSQRLCTTYPSIGIPYNTLSFPKIHRHFQGRIIDNHNIKKTVL